MSDQVRYTVEGHGSGEPLRFGARARELETHDAEREGVPGDQARADETAEGGQVQRSLGNEDEAAGTNREPVTVSMGDTVHVRMPGQPDQVMAYQIPHPSTLNQGTPHDFGASLLNPPDTAFTDHESAKAHIRRLISHVKEYASRLRVSLDGDEGRFLDHTRDRF